MRCEQPARVELEHARRVRGTGAPGRDALEEIRQRRRGESRGGAIGGELDPGAAFGGIAREPLARELAHVRVNLDDVERRAHQLTCGVGIAAAGGEQRGDHDLRIAEWLALVAARGDPRLARRRRLERVCPRGAAQPVRVAVVHARQVRDPERGAIPAERREHVTHQHWLRDRDDEQRDEAHGERPPADHHERERGQRDGGDHHRGEQTGHRRPREIAPCAIAAACIECRAMQPDHDEVGQGVAHGRHPSVRRSFGVAISAAGLLAGAGAGGGAWRAHSSATSR